jgi:hypothetical protein
VSVGWTLETLKEHYDQRFKDQEKAVSAALQAAKEATTKAENASDKRFEATNEFRGQLSDQAAQFMPRPEADLRLKALESWRASQEGRTGGIGGLAGALVSGAGLLIAVAAALIAFNK